MGRKEKLLLKLLAGRADSNFDFDDLVQILIWFDFFERKGKGSHRIFIRQNKMVNLQPSKDGKAKPYQVKQVREFLITSKILEL